MKYIQAKAKLYEIMSTKSSVEAISLTVAFIDGEETEITSLKKSVSKKELLTWLISGFDINSIDSPIVISYKGVACIINELSRYVFTQKTEAEKTEKYKEIIKALPSKSHVEKGYKLYESFLEGLINYDSTSRTLFDELTDEASKKSRQIEFYKRLLQTFK